MSHGSYSERDRASNAAVERSASPSRPDDGSKVLASEVQGLLSAMAAFTAQSADGFESGRVTIQPVRQYTDLLTPSAMV